MPNTIYIPVLSLLSAFVFAVVWNAYVAKQEKNGVEGDTWWWVVIGVGFTVIMSGFVIGWTNMLWVMGFFVSSGIPMIYGSKQRHKKKDKRFNKRLQEMSQDANDTQAAR